MRIIFPNNSGGISVIVPAPGFTVQDCIVNVPSGKPYIIVNESDVPEDRTFREAWTADFSNAEVAQ